MHVWMSEVSKVAGNRGRCVSLLFSVSLQSDFSPVESLKLSAQISADN